MQLPDTLPGRAPDPDDKTEAGKNVSIMRVILKFPWNLFESIFR
jgi:hypothetical protein